MKKCILLIMLIGMVFSMSAQTPACGHELCGTGNPPVPPPPPPPAPTVVCYTVVLPVVGVITICEEVYE